MAWHSKYQGFHFSFFFPPSFYYNYSRQVWNLPMLSKLPVQHKHWHCRFCKWTQWKPKEKKWNKEVFKYCLQGISNGKFGANRAPARLPRNTHAWGAAAYQEQPSYLSRALPFLFPSILIVFLKMKYKKKTPKNKGDTMLKNMEKAIRGYLRLLSMTLLQGNAHLFSIIRQKHMLNQNTTTLQSLFKTVVRQS